jgi:hypothetical protein
MKSEKRYYSGTAEELLKELKKEIKRLKAENKDLKNKKVHYNQDKSGGYIII